MDIMQMVDTILHTPAELGSLQVRYDPSFEPQLDDDRSLPWVSHPGWVLETETDPRLWCQVRADGNSTDQFAWRPGRWHLYAPMTEYQTGYDRSPRPHLCAWVVFPLTYPVPGILASPFSVFADPGERLIAAVMEMHAAQERGSPGYEWTLHGLMVRAIGLLAEATQGGGNGTPDAPWTISADPLRHSTGSETLLARVDRIVSGRLRRAPNIDELAEALSLSPSSLMHRMQTESGWSVIARVRWLRIREARRRLAAHPQPTVKEVARSLAFSSPQYFARVFKEVAGIAPAEYLAQLRAT